MPSFPNQLTLPPMFAVLNKSICIQISFFSQSESVDTFFYKTL